MTDYPDCPACGSDKVSVLPGGDTLKCFGECGGEKHDVPDDWERDESPQETQEESDGDEPSGQTTLGDW